MIRLSIIIPAYNASKYLERCVDSCESQGIPHEEYEVIIINDGSKDDTYNKALELAKKYPNIIVLTQENQGQSVARNKGLDIARGEYVSFVDSDDYLIEGTLCEVLATAEKQKTDVCSYLMDVQGNDGKWTHTSAIGLENDVIYSGEYVMLHNSQVGSCCCSLFLRSFLNQYNLRFYPGIVHQDAEFTTRVHALAKRMLFTNKIVYKYEYNFNSTTRDKKINKLKKSIFDNVIISRNINSFVNNNTHISNTLKRYLLDEANSMYVGHLLNIIISKDKKIRKLLLEYLKFGKRLGIIPIKGRCHSWKTTILIPFINLLSRFLL